MSYRVLALKYRPQTFQDVIGQEHVTTTLSNAITSDRVAHAILLTGPRGTGKTTIARVLAKAMNCAEGPTPTPCNICKSCRQITTGNAADVFEIDGASNNSVDQIRELRANVAYMPASSPFKIYIIDEVHMLSTAAFNALLKTLEEPPGHVIFIFATTESHKIPITILSRCQRHDLGRLKLSQISSHLQRLCREEGFTISRESIDLVASEADGSMRDALSLFDRILSSTPDKEINHDAILNNLGIIDKKIIFDLSSCILNHDVSGLLHIVEQVNNLGLDLAKFYSAVVRQFRNLTVVRACMDKGNHSGAADLTDHDIELIRQMVSRCSVVHLTQILNILLQEEKLIKFASHTRTALEMVLLKIIQIRPGFEVDELLLKLNALAGQIQQLPHSVPEGGTMERVAPFDPSSTLSQPQVQAPPPPPLPSMAAPPIPQTGSSQPTAPRTDSIVPPLETTADNYKTPQHPPAMMPHHHETPQHPSAMMPHHHETPQHPPAMMPHHHEIPQHPPGMMTHHHEVPQHPPGMMTHHHEAPQHPSGMMVHHHEAPQHPMETVPEHNRQPATAGRNGQQHEPKKSADKSWNGFIKAVSKKQRVIATILGKSICREISHQELVFELKGSAFELSRLTAKKSELDAICSDYFGRKMALKIIDGTENRTAAESNSGASTAKIKQEARNHPLVVHAVTLFSGNIVDVRVTS